MTVKRSQSLLFAVDPHLAFHVVDSAGLQGGWMKIRFSLKLSFTKFPLPPAQLNTNASGSIVNNRLPCRVSVSLFPSNLVRVYETRTTRTGTVPSFQQALA
jgi:hypothetical protein